MIIFAQIYERKVALFLIPYGHAMPQEFSNLNFHREGSGSTRGQSISDFLLKEWH